mmetsp:Transcript_14293/g.46768  ORF Transcript_14293/g.46768 Transcript_14293/m.46768 type:complete len:117 (+) Transcript_14293:2227-2577(+)
MSYAEIGNAPGRFYTDVGIVAENGNTFITQLVVPNALITGQSEDQRLCAVAAANSGEPVKARVSALHFSITATTRARRAAWHLHSTHRHVHTNGHILFSNPSLMAGASCGGDTAKA